MARMGHDSERAALIYQHASQNADQGIAAAMTAGLLAFEQERASKQNRHADGDDGTRTTKRTRTTMTTELRCPRPHGLIAG